MVFFPSSSACKMVKDSPNHIPDHMIGYAHTLSEIHIFLVSFDSSNPVWYVTGSKVGITLSAFLVWRLIKKICSAVQWQCATYFSFSTLDRNIIRSLYFIIYQEDVKIKELYNHKPTRKGVCMFFFPSIYLIIAVIIILRND